MKTLSHKKEPRELLPAGLSLKNDQRKSSKRNGNRRLRTPERILEWGKMGVKTTHELPNLYLIINAKNTTSPDMVLNVYGGNI